MVKSCFAITQLRELLKDYEFERIYNMDETSLFYRYALSHIAVINFVFILSLEPDTTLSTTRLKGRRKIIVILNMVVISVDGQ